jgi:hypothetical protein
MVGCDHFNTDGTWEISLHLHRSRLYTVHYNCIIIIIRISLFSKLLFLWWTGKNVFLWVSLWKHILLHEYIKPITHRDRGNTHGEALEHKGDYTGSSISVILPHHLPWLLPNESSLSLPPPASLTVSNGWRGSTTETDRQTDADMDRIRTEACLCITIYLGRLTMIRTTTHYLSPILAQ